VSEIRDPISEGLTLIFSPEEIEDLDAGVAAIAKDTPRLSHDEITRIARTVSDQVIAALEQGNSVDQEQKGKWKRQIFDVGYALATAVAGSALYDLLGYLAHHVLLFDSHDSGAQTREHLRREARARLEARIPEAQRVKFRYIAGLPRLADVIGMQIFRSITAVDEIENMEQQPMGVKRDFLVDLLSRCLFFELTRESALKLGEKIIS